MPKMTVGLDQAVFADLNSCARGLDLTAEGLVAGMVKNFLAETEEVIKASYTEALARLAEFERTRLGAPYEEMRAWMKSCTSGAPQPKL